MLVLQLAGPDAGGIPSQFPIQEDTQFCQILTEAREFFSIPETEHKSYFLVDHKTGNIVLLMSKPNVEMTHSQQSVVIFFLLCLHIHVEDAHRTSRARLHE